MALPAIFLLMVIASIWMAATISQVASKPTSDGAGGAATEGKAYWHKGMKNKMFGDVSKDGSKWMEHKKPTFDRAVDEGLITEEQKATLLDIFTRFHEGEITWEEKLKLIEEAGIDFKQWKSSGQGSKWKHNKGSYQAL